ncbi:MAG: RNA polymerase sigma factor [Chitinophagales bacterium]
MNHLYIIEGFKKNDKKTILTYYEKLFPHILKLIVRDGGNKEDARNIIWQAFSAFRRRCEDSAFEVNNIEGYLYKMAYFLWKKELSRLQNDALNRPIISNPKGEDFPVIDEEDFMYGEKEEAIKQFKEILSQLPPTCRQIIRMRFLHELPHEDIAMRLNITADNSRQQLRRCIKRLVKKIDNQDTGKILAHYYPGIQHFIEKYKK